MKELALALFVVGIALSGLFAARPGVLPERGTDPEAASREPATRPTAGERIEAWADAAGLPFLGSFALMLAGGLLARRAARQGRKRPVEGKDKAPETGLARVIHGSVDEALAAVAEEVDGLPAAEPASVPDELHEKLDHLLEETVPAFIERRLELANTLGLASYAEMIGHFAGMERNLARAWSALTDEVFDEVGPSLDRARASLTAARESVAAALEAAGDSGSAGSSAG